MAFHNLSTFDDEFQKRQDELTRQREEQLNQARGRSGATSARATELAALANLFATTGGVVTGQLPDATPFINAIEKDESRLTNLDRTDIQGRESDATRISSFIRTNFEDKVKSEETEFNRGRLAKQDERQTRLDRRSQFGSAQLLKLDTGETVLGKLNKDTGEFVHAGGDQLGSKIRGKIVSISQVGADQKGRFQGQEKLIDKQSGERFVQTTNSATGLPQTVSVRSGKILEPGDPQFQNLVRESIDVAGDTATARKVGAEVGDQRVTLFTNARSAAETDVKLDRLEKALEGLSTGFATGNAGSQAAISAFKQLTGKDPLDVSSREAADQTIQELVGNVRQTMKGQGTITDGEQALILKRIPNLTNSPEGNAKIIEIMRAGNRRAIQKAKDWNEAFKADPSTDFFNWELQWFQDNVVADDRSGDSGGSTTATPASTPANQSQREDIRRKFRNKEITREEARRQLEALKAQEN